MYDVSFFFGVCCNGCKSGLKIVVEKVSLSHLSIART